MCCLCKVTIQVVLRVILGSVMQRYNVRFVQYDPRIDQISGLHMYSGSLLESNCFIFKGIAAISRVCGVYSSMWAVVFQHKRFVL